MNQSLPSLPETMQIVRSCRYTHPDIGPITVRVNANSRHVRARWVGPEVLITIPRNYPAENYEQFLRDFADKIMSHKPQARFYDGQIIDGNYADFEIRVSDSRITHGSYLKRIDTNPLRGKERNYIINIGPGVLDRMALTDPRAQNIINKLLIHCAISATGDFLVPRARRMAAAIERSPLGWNVKDSRTRLGSCSSNGIITLSPRLIFLPFDLADYIIFHELAHLSEMNHSAAFHQVCDTYCNGLESELRARVKAFDFPVF